MPPKKELASKDPRFARIHSDPRFQRPKKRDAKVVIDDRFAHMLSDREFKASATVDKYGRKLKDEGDIMKRYYRIEEQQQEKGESEEAEKSKEESEEESEEDSEEDYMRGEGSLESSEDELDAINEATSDEEVPIGAETCRFAIVNLDWDNIKAVDLYAILKGFKPDGGVIKSVQIYPSEFGKERLAKEAAEGPPKEIFDLSKQPELSEEENEEDEEKLIQNDEEEQFNQQALRKYQIERLKYFFAVVECDSVQTARYIYNECDGTEYESSGNFFDLRFVPDDVKFDDEPRDKAVSAPVTYKPREFITQVLQHSSLKLTWDEDDPDRTKVTRKSFTKGEIEDMDFKAYVASSSSENSDEDEKERARKLYRALLQEDKLSEDEGNMEITFAPGLSEKNEKLKDALSEQLEMSHENTLDTYMRKQKEKRKVKKQAKKEKIDDPFFDQSDEEPNPTKSAKPTKADKERERAELELLMDDDDNDKHFNLRDIIKNKNNDDFELDVHDERFSAMHESHLYAVDPTNPNFKKTTGMEKILKAGRIKASEKETELPKEDIKGLINSVKRKSDNHRKGIKRKR